MVWCLQVRTAVQPQPCNSSRRICVQTMHASCMTMKACLICAPVRPPQRTRSSGGQSRCCALAPLRGRAPAAWPARPAGAPPPALPRAVLPPAWGARLRLPPVLQLAALLAAVQLLGQQLRAQAQPVSVQTAEPTVEQALRHESPMPELQALPLQTALPAAPAAPPPAEQRALELAARQLAPPAPLMVPSPVARQAPGVPPLAAPLAAPLLAALLTGAATAAAASCLLTQVAAATAAAPLPSARASLAAAEHPASCRTQTPTGSPVQRR